MVSNISGCVTKLKDVSETSENLINGNNDDIESIFSGMEQMSAAMKESNASLMQIDDIVAELMNIVTSLSSRTENEAQAADETLNNANKMKADSVKKKTWHCHRKMK